MPIWENFEVDSTAYLNRTFGRYASFDCKGGSDSTVSDIKVTTKNGKGFYIEAKHCPAQSGQFVLLPNIEKRIFEYSRLNVTTKNCYSEAIIMHMNEHFEEYKEAGTRGKDIDIENGSSIFAAWIVEANKAKGVEFVITNNNIILPIKEFSSYFNVTAKYRIKRSGSSGVANGQIQVVSEYLKNNYPVLDVTAENKKLFVTSKQYLHDKRFVISGTEYMISQRGERYEIRKLSNTFNANVIFSIDLKPGARGISNEEFISFLL